MSVSREMTVVFRGRKAEGGIGLGPGGIRSLIYISLRHLGRGVISANEYIRWNLEEIF